MENRNYGKGLGKPEINWNIAKEEVSLPAACLNLSNVKNNIEWMKKFCDGYGAQLSPHVKTTMCPDIIKMQAQAGIWGATTATVNQTKVIHDIGVKRNLMANQLIGRRNMEIVSEILRSDPSFEFFVIVDSAKNIEDIANYFMEKQLTINVLIEIGISNVGRTGVRTQEDFDNVFDAINRLKSTIKLRGVEFFEGILNDEESIRKLCVQAGEYAKQIVPFIGDNKIIVSGAGSAWFDIVAEELNKLKLTIISKEIELLILLRPGCYVTHDGGLYSKAQERIQSTNKIARELGSLKPALQVIAYVQSRPQKDLIIIGMGRRDVAIDCGFPIPILIISPGETVWRKCPTYWKGEKIMDHHLFVKVKIDDQVNVGDIVVFDISHPCNTFSAWQSILLVDENYITTNITKTFF